MQEQEYDWIIWVGGGYGDFEFRGTAAEAEEVRRCKANWEGAPARKFCLPLNGKDAAALASCRESTARY